MRVSDSMMYQQATYNMDSAQSQVQSLTNENSTGVAVTHPWDDPAAASLAVEYQIQGARAGAIAQATSSAQSELSLADGALNTVSDQLSKAVQLAQQLGSGILTASQMQAGVQEVSAIQASIVSALNAQMGNRYIFGGTLDSSPPFDAAGNYSGNSEVRQVEVAPGIYQNASVRADVAVKGANGGVDAFAALTALSNALSSNNINAVFASEGNLQAAFNQVNNVRSQEGSDAAALQTANTVNQAVQLGQTTGLSNSVDANMIDAATQLAQAQNVLQSAITASSKEFQLTFTTAVPSGG